MADIFLSYTEKDREQARRLAATLESVGWTVWWDRRIPAGETWRNVLQQALHDMRCMVVLWSARSIESEWVCEEATEGRRLDRLVPVLIEQVRPPAGFREIQAADLTGWDGTRDHEGMRMLVADLENLLGKPGTAGAKGASAASAGSAANKVDRAAVERIATHGRPYDPADLAIGDEPVGPATQRAWLPWAVAVVLVLAAAAVYVSLSPPAPKPETLREPISSPQEGRPPEKRADTRSTPTEPSVEMRSADAARAMPATKPDSKKPDPGTRVRATRTRRNQASRRTSPHQSALQRLVGEDPARRAAVRRSHGHVQEGVQPMTTEHRCRCPGFPDAAADRDAPCGRVRQSAGAAADVRCARAGRESGITPAARGCGAAGRAPSRATCTTPVRRAGSAPRSATAGAAVQPGGARWRRRRCWATPSCRPKVRRRSPNTRS